MPVVRYVCAVPGCNATKGLHCMPREPSLQSRWLDFIGLVAEPKATVKVCNAHFTEESFTNTMKVRMGFHKHYLLAENAVPTVYAPAEDTVDEEPTASSDYPTVVKQTRKTACQTDPPPVKRNCSLQAAIKPIRRNKACQVTPSRHTVSCDTRSLAVVTVPMSPMAESTPMKRGRCELDDSSYHPSLSSSFTDNEGPSDSPPVHTKKYIVYEDCLLQLFKQCPVCSRTCNITKWVQGTLLHVSQTCPHCQHSYKWNSQPMVQNIPAGNLHLSAATLFTGSSFTQIQKVNQTFGHLYKNLHINVVSIAVLEEAGVKIASLVTDRHPQIQKYLRVEKPSIQHFFDVWHVAKAVGKKIDALAKDGRCKEVGLWRKSIVNHTHWLVTTGMSGEERVGRWKSVVNHIQDVHEHDEALFPECLHRPLVGEEAREWLKPSTMPCEKLSQILLQKKLLSDVEKLSPSYQTSSIEAFHSLILRFAPKNVVYSFHGMLCRLLLAAQHYNENANRQSATKSSGELQYKLWYPKYKCGDFPVRAFKTQPTYNYIDTLLELLFERVVEDPQTFRALLEQINVPPPLCSQYERPDKTEAVARHKSRFSKF